MTHKGGMYVQFIHDNTGMPKWSMLNNLKSYLAWEYEKKEVERVYNVVLRKQGWFCKRCGQRKELMYEGKLIRFEEKHVCNPKNVLKKKIQVMERGW